MTLLELANVGVVFLCRDLELQPLPADAPLPEWIHLVPYGVWRGHPMGAFTVGPEQARQILANWPQRDLVMDWEHQTHMVEKNGLPAPAAAWLDRAEIRADGVWAHVREWTPRAAQQLRDREYRFLSPAVAWSYPNKVTGKDQGATMLSVGLTNNPFFDVLTPLLARASNPGRTMFTTLLALLGLPETAAPAEAEAAAKGLIDRNAALCRAFGLDPATKLADIEAAAKPILARASLGEAAATELQLDPKALPENAKATLCSALKHSGYVPYEVHVAALERGAREVAAVTDDQLIEKAIREGKITPATEGWYRAQVKVDRPGIEALLFRAAPVVPVTSPITGREPARSSTATALSPEDKAYCRSMGISEDEFRKANATLHPTKEA